MFIRAKVHKIKEAIQKGYHYNGAAKFTNAKDYRKDFGCGAHSRR